MLQFQKQQSMTYDQSIKLRSITQIMFLCNTAIILWHIYYL